MFLRKNIFLAFITILFIFLFIDRKPIYAQENNKQFVEIEISKKKELFSHEAKVPFTENPYYDDEKRVLIEGEFYGIGMRTSGCKIMFDVFCGGYFILSYAKRLSENSSEIHVRIDFENKRKCSIKDTGFVIQRGKREEFKLKCGIKLTAYYE